MPDFLQKIQAHLRLIAFLVAALMLGAIVYLKMSDTGPNVPKLPDTPAPVPLPLKPEVAQAINQEFSRGDVPIEKSPLHSLIADDMFSSKAIQANIQNVKRADDKYAEAEKAKASGNKDEALRLAKEALAIYPHHLNSIRMQKELEAPSGAAEAGATSGTAVTVPAVGKAPAGVVVPKVAPVQVGVPPAGAGAPAPAKN